MELVGRDAELQAIRDALRTMPGPAGIVLEGEAGIGKSALWQAGIAEAEGLRWSVAGARPAEAESALSHAALGDLLGTLCASFGGALPMPQRHALDVAFLRSAPDAGGVDPHAVGAATLGLLRAASARAPLLLAIDDIQWLDSASAAAVAFALRRLGGEPVALLATLRLGREAEAVDTGLATDRITRIPLGPLELDALHRVLQDRLGEPVPRPALARLAEVSGGNPYYALELGRAALRQSEGSPLSAELSLPEGIYAVLQDRLRTLPPGTRDALGTVAALGHPTFAAAGAAVDPPALDPAFAAGVLHEHRDTIHFEHPLLAEAAYRLLPRSRRQELHARLAELATDPEERARHLAAATTAPDARVAADIEAGADAAAGRGAPAAAAELLEAAARLEPDSEMATRRRITAVHWHVAAADGRRAAALAADLVAELPAGPLRSRALVAQAYQEGSVDELLAISSQAVTEAGDDTEALIDALLMKGLYLMIQGRDAEGYECTKRALGLCDADTPMPLRIQAMTFHGERAQWRGEPEGIRLLVEAAELEGDDLFLDAYRGPNATLGRTLAFADELEEGRRMLEDRRQRALELGDDESRAGLSLHLAELEVKAGRFDVALRLAEECLAIVEGSYAEEAQSAPSYVIALIRGHQGDISLARKIAEDGLARCVAQNDLLFGAIHRATLGFLELSVGDNAAAVEWLSPVVDRFRESRDDPGLPHNARIPDAIEALTALDRLDEAEELLEAWDETGERFDRPRVRASSARCRALIGAARGELEPALERALSAVEQHADLPLPFERARTLIVLGSVQRRVKKKAAARESLEEALQLLDAIGERLWPPRAHAELARISGRAPSGGLTATEERVADLVAGGRSNKEVAAELFVSVRTVEANLTRIYAKLGIRSRTELAGRRGR